MKVDPLFIKLLFVGALVLVLLLPLASVWALISERQARQATVKAELAATWGGAQTLAGPLLAVPYAEHEKTAGGNDITRVSWAYFLPEELRIEGAVEPEVRSRGIFDLVLYRARLTVSGSFRRPDFSDWKIADGDIRWDEARLSIGIPDLRGIQQAPILNWDGRPIAFEPGAGAVDLYASALQAPAPGLASQETTSHAFDFELGLAGSEELHFVPGGKKSEVALTSTWRDPSFIGAFLPTERSVDDAGFRARWEISYFARGYPQQWRRSDTLPDVERSSFGLRLLDPVDFYRMSERSVKYGILFVLLTFLTFGLFELLARLRIHPVQYLLVGLAICLFYLVLLSVSEQLGFAPAYAIGSLSTIGLIGGYTRAVLGASRRSIVVVALLGGLYGYLYVLLQLEDYALLLGTAGLFLILATVMYLTRKLDWYAVGKRPDPEPIAVAR